MSAWGTYEVTVQGFGPAIYSASSPGRARARAWADFNHAFECAFKDFLKISRVRKCPTPQRDGYAQVRAQYGVDPKIGARVRLVNEGPSTGLEGAIIYPGEHTAHVHVVLDGRDHAVLVHPTNIEFIPNTRERAEREEQ